MILLDTHAWIWWVAKPARLSSRSRGAIEQEDALGICAISCWEVAMLVAKKRLEIDRDIFLWIRQALSLPRVILLPLTAEIAIAASRMPVEFPGDPADRMIAATAIGQNAAVASKDARFRSVPRLRTIW